MPIHISRVTPAEFFENISGRSSCRNFPAKLKEITRIFFEEIAADTPEDIQRGALRAILENSPRRDSCINLGWTSGRSPGRNFGKTSRINPKRDSNRSLRRNFEISEKKIPGWITAKLQMHADVIRGILLRILIEESDRGSPGEMFRGILRQFQKKFRKNLWDKSLHELRRNLQ